MVEVVKEAVTFLELTQKLKGIGFRKKDIASHLEMHAPVFSSLVQTVFPNIASIDLNKDESFQEREINEAFSMVNNLSQSKTISKLEFYNTRLKELVSDKIKPTESLSYFAKLRFHAEGSFDYIKQYFEGVYYMYYVSTDNYNIKREAFIIKANSVDKYFECIKGNQHSRIRYNGICLVVSMHTLSLHLVEENEQPEEFLMMNLTIPFIRKMGYLRGIFNTLNYSRQPIARKMIIHQITGEVDEDLYNNLEVNFYDDPQSMDYPEIGEYLYSDCAKTECYGLLKPKFDLSDLVQEVEVARKAEQERK